MRASDAGAAHEAVEITLSIKAEPETVFRFFSDPVRFARWWATPGGGKATIEARPGGAVRIEFQNGKVMAGQIVEVRAPELFVMTWGYSGGNEAVPAGSTRIEVTLAPIGRERGGGSGGTLLTLRHTGIPAGEQRTGYAIGWKYYLSVVAAEASHDQFAAPVAALADAWFRAWNTQDAAERRRLLSSCVEDGVSLRTPWACLDGLDEVNGHISNTLKHMPGLTLEPAGPAQEIHGFVRMPWRTTAPGGKVVFQGVNVAELSASGKVVRMVGFWDPPRG